MRSSLLLSTAALLLLAVFMASPAGSHNFKPSDCAKCHLEPEGHPKALRAGISKLCVPCHKETVRTSSHPVNVSPRRAKVPPDFPLRKGKITCVTCHYAHRPKLVHRGSSPSIPFCRACHADEGKPGHENVITLAHMGSKFRGKDTDKVLDRLSMACLGCHQTMFSLPSERHQEDVAMMKPHLAGINYRASQKRSGGRLRPVEALDPAIQFFGGNIGCGTCHDMYSMLPKKLAMQDLCIQCHVNVRKSHRF